MASKEMTYGELKERKLHTMVHRMFGLLLSEQEGKRLMETYYNFIKSHTTEQLRAMCVEKGVKANGTKGVMAQRLLTPRFAENDPKLDAYKTDSTVKVDEMMRKHKLVQLREMCKEKGLSTTGNKRGLAVRFVES